MINGSNTGREWSRLLLCEQEEDELLPSPLGLIRTEASLSSPLIGTSRGPKLDGQFITGEGNRGLELKMNQPQPQQQSLPRRKSFNLWAGEQM